MANILLLANNAHNTSAVIDHINAIVKGSKLNWIVENPLKCKVLHKMDLNAFDAIGMHYSIRPYDDYYFPQALYKKIKAYNGVKFQFLQDEYQNVDRVAHSLIDLNIDIFFTLVKPSLFEKAYPYPEFRKIKMVSVLTGYVPESLLNFDPPPIRDRSIDIFYRTRLYDFWLGELTQERKLIADGVIARAKENNLKIDIELNEKNRIYGEEWVKRHFQSKSVLGTESGASIWDFTGDIVKKTKRAISKNPNSDFKTIQKETLSVYEGNILYNAISPRVFEAIALKTPLIMFPGEYNNVCIADKHFIMLEKDFSNFKEVVLKLRDNDYLQEIADTAYCDIIQSGKFSSEKLMAIVETEIELKLKGKLVKSEKSIDTTINSLNQIKQKTTLLNTILVVISEFKFTITKTVNIICDPRYSMWEKIKVIGNGYNRYLAYLLPRYKKNYNE